MLTFAQACAEMQQADRTLLLYEGGGVRFSEVNLTDCRTLALVVGSEGGFDPEEAEQLSRTALFRSGWDTAFSAVRLHLWRRSPLPCTAPATCNN